ncbi:MAG: hypothetical protein AB2A00_27905 [Myxococcota bacterium]
MRLSAMVMGVATLAASMPAYAQYQTQAEQEAQLDPGTRREVRRKRLQTEFMMLEDSRTTTFGSDMGTEGRLFTIRFPLASYYYEDNVAGAVSRKMPHPFSRYANLMPKADNGIQDDVMAELPPFRMTFMDDGETMWGELGAIETTFGHGSVINRYLNNPSGGFNLNTFGVVVGARAKSVGGSVMTGNILEPGRFLGFNVHGRPLEWIYGTYSNVEPEAAGNLDYYALLLSALTVGVTGAMDTQAPAMVKAYALDNQPAQVPGTAGALALEGDVGINHSIISAHVYANATMLGRTFREAGLGTDGRATTGESVANLWGAGVSPGVRFNLFLELLKIGGAFEYRLAGPNYMPAYFDRNYEADRIAYNGTPKITRRTMARHGYSLQLGAQLLKTFGLFFELDDLVQLDPRFGKNEASMRLGGILHVLGVLSFMGAYVNRGFQDYTRAWEPARTSMLLGETRLSLLFFSLVARQWRTWEPMEDGKMMPRNGNSFMAEFQIGVL